MSTTATQPYTFARMAAEHADTVRLLEMICFGRTKGTIAQLREWLTLPCRHGIVCLLGGKVVGFALYLIARDRPSTSPPSFVAVPNLAVHPDHRRQGIATRLLAGVEAASAHVQLPALVTAQEDWLAAHLLLRANGFTCTRIEKRLCEGELDAYCFRKDPPQPDDPP